MLSLLIIAKFQKINNYKFTHNNLRGNRSSKYSFIHRWLPLSAPARSSESRSWRNWTDNSWSTLIRNESASRPWVSPGIKIIHFFWLASIQVGTNIVDLEIIPRSRDRVIRQKRQKLRIRCMYAYATIGIHHVRLDHIQTGWK